MISPRERPIFYNDLKSLPLPKRRSSPLPRIGIAAIVGATALFLLGNINRESPATEPAAEIAVQSLKTVSTPVSVAGIAAASSPQQAISPPHIDAAANSGANYKAVDEPGSSTLSLDLAPRLEPIEPVALPDTAKRHAQPSASANKTPPRWESHQIRKGDTLSAIFARAGLDPREATAVSRAARKYRFDRKLGIGKSISILKSAEGGLDQLKYELDVRGQLNIAKSKQGYRAEYIKYDIETSERTVEGVIRTSFNAAAGKADLPRSLARELASVFRNQINLAKSLRPGDSFTIIYREERIKERIIKNGPVLAAEFKHRGKTYQAIRYRDKTGYVSYYTPEGENLKQGFIRTPVRGARITSRFGARRHPLSHRWKKHTGVDYAARINTPVLATGDGIVKFAKREGGYGKTIVIQHSKKYSTLYAHLNGYKKGIRGGVRVKKGQVIGYVGNTGVSTGPHLHHEFRINGKPKDPLKVKLPESLPIASTYRRDFLAQARTWEGRLTETRGIRVARNSTGSDARSSAAL